ncbi:feruloyl esterase b precursor [Colletotrichum karsti]|uniref:Carboxylic ester hydrolase n=1 Tax=Colletotrichum karsti TaxID=1095194 RepID=A0A9P6I6E4_9PEZI|nr:feruloyl esterase b precursor [Colletotrichum karsti]KAF9876849.1 feruloyl esterase b precursor [Colletotrichum karsti]
MKWIASLTLTLAALRHAAATNSTSCTPRLMSYWINANASIGTVTSVDEAGSFQEDGNIAYPVNVTNLPSLCAVTFVAKTREGNATYKFGLFLPDEWNDHVLTVGNEGYDGGVNWPAMAAGVKYGFVTVSTDGGHNSTSNNLTWALGDENKQLDFGFRALHGSYQLAQRVIQRYYNLPAKKSYFAGTGQGGRQGLKAAQLYPRDFNAILIGAPAWWQSHLQSWRVSRATLNGGNDTKILTAESLKVLGDNVRKQCDASDGVEDGIISNLASCYFDFSLFTCGGDGVDASACLTTEQVEVAKKLYDNYEVDDEKVFPGLSPSSEYEWTSVLGDNDTDVNEEALGYFKNFIYDADWEASSYNDSVPAYANETNPGELDVNSFNLTQFASLGHKIIMYHGTADGVNSLNASIQFYESVVNATGGDIEATRSWFRLFLVPGLGSKNTSVDAPWYIGGPGQWEQLVDKDAANLTGVLSDPKYDALSALVAWESDATVPESIIATTWTNSTDTSTGVLRQRPICPWPATQKYIGEGDQSKPESFVC